MNPKNPSNCGPKNNQATHVAQKTFRPLWPRKQPGHCGPENNQATHSTLTDPILPQQPLAALPFSLELRDSNEHQRIRWRARTIADGDHRRERPALVDEAVVSAANAPSSDADHRPQNFTPETPIAHDETRAAIQIRRASMLVVLAAATQYNTSAQH